MLFFYLADSTASLVEQNKSIHIARKSNHCFLLES